MLETDGPTNWTGNSAINMDNGTINNYGTWTANSSSTLQADGNPGGVNAFNNESSGTFTQQGTGTTYFTNYETGVAFNNAGQVNVSQGGLDLASGGSQTGAFSIAAGSTFLLNGTQNFSAASTVNCAGTLSVSGGTASFSNTPTIAALNVSGGTLEGAGSVTIDGTMNWTGGTIASTGTTKIAAGATLNISNTVSVDGVLETDGTTTWTGGDIIMSNGTINNYGSWTANSTGLDRAYSNTASTVNVFNNEAGATLTQQGTGTTEFFTNIAGVALNNAGTVNVNKGTLELLTGGTQTGGFTVGSGSTLGLSGTQSFSSSSSISGSGTMNILGGTTTFVGVESLTSGTLNVSGGTVDFNTAVSFASASISGGTLGGSGNVTFSGTVNWTGTTIAGTGLTDVASTGALNISSSVALAGVLETDGTTTWTGGDIIMSNGTINNYGSWTANSTGLDRAYSNTASTVNVFNNEAGATLTQQGTGTTEFFTNIAGVALNNAGTVNVNKGTLELLTGGTQTGGFTVGSGSTLGLSGTQSFSSSSSISGSGTMSILGGTTTFVGVESLTSGTLNVSGGTVDFNTAVSFASASISGGTLGGSGNVTFSGTVNWTGTTIAGTGLTDVASTGALNISSSVALAGVLETDGTTTWTGGDIIMSNGTINNYGSWTANSTGPDRAYSNTASTVNVFNNEAGATLTQQGTGTTEFFTNIVGVALNNAGTVNVNKGTLELNSGVMQVSGGTLTGGTWNVAAGATLTIANAAITTNGGNITLGGTGELRRHQRTGGEQWQLHSARRRDFYDHGELYEQRQPLSGRLAERARRLLPVGRRHDR